MPMEIRAPEDEREEAVASPLEAYAPDHPRAEITPRRDSPASVRGRIAGPAFAAMRRVGRDLDRPSEAEKADVEVDVVLLLAPDEVETPPGDIEFEHPVAPSSAGV